MAKKELGQNWLVDNQALEDIVASLTLEEETLTVLEIGPGLGYLTDKLLKTNAGIIALEFDEELIPKLHAKYAHLDSDKFDLKHADIRTFELSELPDGYRICANIPYYLTANLMRILTDTDSKPEQAVLLVQKEVAQKLSASTKRSMLSVLVQSHYYVSTGRIVEAELFQPAPKVDSQVLILDRIAEPIVSLDQWDEFVRLVKTGFSSPRKKLSANLSPKYGDKDAARDTLVKAGIDQDCRPGDLAPKDWLKLLS